MDAGKQLLLDHSRIAEAKARKARWYRGEKNDRVPFTYTVGGAPLKYSWGEKVRDDAKAIEDFITDWNWQAGQFPNCDRIPVFSPVHLGEGLVPSMFGAVQYIVEDNFPFTEGRIITDLARDLPRLPRRINPETDGWGPRLKALVERFLDATHGEVPVGICDTQSPFGVACKLMDGEELIYALMDTPELAEQLLDICTTAIIDTVRAMERWVGRPELLVKNYNCPALADSFVIWDDYISVLSPSLHQQHCHRHNMRLFQTFGRGHLHTCGPNFPGYIDAVLAHGPASVDAIILRGMSRTREDLLEMKRLTLAQGAQMNASLTTFATHIHSRGEAVPPDEDFVLQMAGDGQLHWTEGGTVERGNELLKMVDAMAL